MKVLVIPVTSYQQNCSLIWCEHTHRAALVDPGGDVDRLLAEVEKRGLTLERLLITHGHLDHAGGVAELTVRLGDRKSTRLNSSHVSLSRMPSSA